MSNQAGLGLGDTVHNQEINEYPEEWKQEYLRISNWAKQTARQFGRRVVVHIIDPQSAVGMWKLLRHGIRRYPTVILNGRTRFVGWEATEAAHRQIAQLLNS